MWKRGIARDPAAEIAHAARPAAAGGSASLLLPSLHFQLLSPALQLLLGFGFFILQEMSLKTEVAWWTEHTLAIISWIFSS